MVNMKATTITYTRIPTNNFNPPPNMSTAPRFTLPPLPPPPARDINNSGTISLPSLPSLPPIDWGPSPPTRQPSVFDMFANGIRILFGRNRG